MFDMDDQTSSASSLKSEDQEAFDSLAHKVGIHLFGDNVSVFNKDHQADKGDGSWEILIDNFQDDDFWVVPVVYLVPVGIDLWLFHFVALTRLTQPVYTTYQYLLFTLYPTPASDSVIPINSMSVMHCKWLYLLLT